MSAVAEVFKELVGHADQIRTDMENHVRTCSPGDTWWQGDLGIQYLGSEKPDLMQYYEISDKHVSPDKGLQLADGNTEGSRHILFPGEGSPEIRIYKKKDRLRNPLFGNVMELKSDSMRVDHPVHGDVIFYEPGFYLARFQRQFTADQLVHRAFD